MRTLFLGVVHSTEGSSQVRAFTRIGPTASAQYGGGDAEKRFARHQMKENMVHLSKDFKTAFKTGRKESSQNRDKNALEDSVAP